MLNSIYHVVSNHYYSYGKTINNKYFEVASVLRENEISKTKLDGTYPGEYGPISLIREYNGGIFISNNSQTHLPYNPDEHVLIAKDDSGNIYRVGQTITTNPGETKTLYFSDGSISELQEDSSLTLSEMDFKTPENNLTTKIKLFLSSGTIFTKATALNSNSDFEVYTLDTTAAVRGTVFSVEYTGGQTNISILEGRIEAQNQRNYPEHLNPINPDEASEIIENLRQGTSENDYEQRTIETETRDKLEDFINQVPEENLPVGKNCELDGQGELICDSGDTEAPEENPIEEPGLPLTCEFNGQPISSQIIAYQFEQKGSESECEAYSEVRICNHETGELSGSFQYSQCYFPLSCSIGSITGGTKIWNPSINNYGPCTYTQANIIPGETKTSDLSGEFEMEFVLTSIPTKKEYLLYGGDNFRLFFDNKPTGQNQDICYQQGSSALFCKTVGTDKKINFKRDNFNKIYLNGIYTSKITSDIIGTMDLGYWNLNGTTPILLMDSGNKINFKIIK